MEAYPFAHRQRVRYGETDMQQVVYYANYLLYAEVGRVAYLRELGLDYTREFLDRGRASRRGARPLMDLELPEELRLLQTSVRKFVDETLAPHEKEIEERDEIPRPLIEAMGDAGLFGIGHEERWGGQGFGKLGYCV